MRSGTMFGSVVMAMSLACSGSPAGERTLGGGSGNGAPIGSGTGTGTGQGSGGTLSINPAGGTGGSVANGECAQANFKSSRRPTEMLLVLDRSGSMDEHEISPGVTRWAGVVPIVNDAVTATDSAVAWGLKVFPEGMDNTCQASSVTSAIDVEIANGNAANVVAKVNQTTPQGDGTPTGDAIVKATAYLAGRKNDNNKFILLATDGEPSCPSGDSGRTFAATSIGNALAAGFPVFVVGVLDPKPSDTTLGALNSMAVAGGKPRTEANPLAQKFYLASTKDELTAALREITGEIASCVFKFTSPPPDPTNIAVKVNGKGIAQDSTHGNGWDYTDGNHMGVEVFGASCNDIQTLSDNQIDMIFGCPGVPIN